MPEFTDRVFAAVRKVPRGKVASYGTVAKVAGYPRAARQVGMVMRLGRGLPWWRVLAADGRIVIADPTYKMEQAMRLEMEGVVVREMRVDMDRFGWDPPTGGARASRTSRKAAAARPADAPRARSRASPKKAAKGRSRPRRNARGPR